MKTDEYVPRASGEQLLYARILAVGMFTGLGLLLVTFALYVTGIVEPAVPIHALPEYWGLSAAKFHTTSASPRSSCSGSRSNIDFLLIVLHCN